MCVQPILDKRTKSSARFTSDVSENRDVLRTSGSYSIRNDSNRFRFKQRFGGRVSVGTYRVGATTACGTDAWRGPNTAPVVYARGPVRRVSHPRRIVSEPLVGPVGPVRFATIFRHRGHPCSGPAVARRFSGTFHVAGSPTSKAVPTAGGRANGPKRTRPVNNRQPDG